MINLKIFLEGNFFCKFCLFTAENWLRFSNLCNSWTFNLRDLTEVKWSGCGMEKDLRGCRSKVKSHSF